jgi:UDP-glucose 4-epimerase
MKIIHGQARLGDVKRNFSDTTKAKTQLGWEAEIDVDTGIQKTVDWFCDQERK